jgi:hypothetical protein
MGQQNNPSPPAQAKVEKFGSATFNARIVKPVMKKLLAPILISFLALGDLVAQTEHTDVNFQGRYKTITTYDAKDRKISEVVQILTRPQNLAETALSDWKTYTEHYYTYDKHDNMVSDLYKEWDGNAIHIYLDTYTYNRQKHTNHDLQPPCTDTAWLNWYRHTYNPQNNIAGDVRQTWNGTKWVNLYQNTFHYDSNKIMDTNLSQMWDSTSAHWVNWTKISRAYCVKNNTSNETDQNWNCNLHTWVNDALYNVTYNQSHAVIGNIRSYWNGTAWVTPIRRFRHPPVGRASVASL